jgi:hypothetical protein
MKLRRNQKTWNHAFSSKGFHAQGTSANYYGFFAVRDWAHICRVLDVPFGWVRVDDNERKSQYVRGGPVALSYPSRFNVFVRVNRRDIEKLRRVYRHYRKVYFQIFVEGSDNKRNRPFFDTHWRTEPHESVNPSFPRSAPGSTEPPKSLYGFHWGTTTRFSAQWRMES